ncbi:MULTISPECIES: LacI family DNA-binding transcriptional regulator [Acidobacteriaceae]|uniref:LacI family DNA-binding transcriptional regulator n=1 Tax=Acidobacteriaceae TaxID=204434 RepID=UPI00131DBCF6|nr:MULTISPECIES: LacI family DNA-binding transcriptional regulator [Acidobacteriaceae]MDW5265503.1 LacI family DNA-binding transcriptional regulator [Edaphobacter sp.]
MSAPKLADIAKRAGVSIAAVSIALNNRDTKRVGAAKREEIHRIAEELSYTPNELAKALAEQKTRLLGLMVPLRDPIFFNHFIAQALSGIQATLMRRGYNLLVYSPSGRPGRSTRDQILESKFTDGLIFINTRSCSTRDVAETVQELNAAQIKFTMINSYYGRAPVNYVGVDDPAIGEAAVHYLVERDHRCIAFLSGSEKLPTHIHLLQGMRRALVTYGEELPPDRIGCTGYDEMAAFAILDRWFQSKRMRPTAIFCADDQLLMHLYDYIEARRMKIPEDVSVLGRGNAGLISLLRPRPTAFYIPTFEMGELAAEMLIDSIEQPTTNRQRVMLPFKLHIGQTA